VGAPLLADLPPAAAMVGIGPGAVGAGAVLAGAIIAFFAFIGFEDMINVAEETRDPERTVPLGLILAMAAAAVLYISVAVTAVSVVPWKELGAAPGPITAVMERAAPTLPPVLFIAITMFAVANTALVNYVTASRLVYGMARQGLLPHRLGDVHAARRILHLAVASLFLVLAPLALLGTITELAAATVLLLLFVFMVVNGALFILKGRDGERRGRFEIPRAIPAFGALTCLILIVVRVATGDWRAPALAGALLLGAFALHLLIQRKR
jgi:amino acid transporter